MSNTTDLRGDVAWKEAPLDNANEKVARVHQILGGLYGVMAVVFLGAYLMSGPRGVEWVAALVIAVPALVHGLLALGALKRNGGSRVASLIVGVLMLPGFPIGTAVGVYLIRHSSASWSR